MADIRDWFRRNDPWIRQIINFNLVETNITSSVLLILVVLLLLAGNIYAGSALGILLLAIFLIRKLPELKSLSVTGLFKAEWYKQVVLKERESADATAEVRPYVEEFKRVTKELLDKKEYLQIPSSVIQNIEKMNGTATVLDEKLTIVETANNEVKALLSRGPVSWIDGNGVLHTAFEMSEPMLKIPPDEK